MTAGTGCSPDQGEPEPAAPASTGSQAPAVSAEDQERAAQLYKRAMRFVRERRPDEAAPEFRRALEIDPGHRDAHFNLGLVLVHLSDVVVGTDPYFLLNGPIDATNEIFKKTYEPAG